MNEADRIIRDRIRKEEAERRADAAREEANKAMKTRRQEDAIFTIVPDVLAVLKSRGYPELESVRATVFRFPPLGDLFGTRTITKGGWEIASWDLGRETNRHHIWLLGDGKFVWNGRLVGSYELRPYHGMMLAGLTKLKERHETA